MKWTRFERKILAAIVVAALTPLVGALVLGQAALRESYQVGVNESVRAELERGLLLYREHFVTLRKHGEEVTTAIGDDFMVRRALAERDDAALQQRLRELLVLYTDVARVTLHDDTGRTLAEISEPARASDALRPLQIVRPLNEPGAGEASGEATESATQLSVTVVAPAQAFVDYQRAGELAEVYRRLERGAGDVAGFYLVVYMGFLLSVIVVALATGIVMSRRVTRRVSLLADATRKVGKGDLAVQVPTDTRDEIGDLTRDFNAMVRDLRESRGRIEYLQRIGAWQEFARRLAHEIKNPLTPIQLAIQEVHRTYPGDDAAFARRLAEARSIIEEEVATLRTLTSEFSTFARLPEATLSPADLNDFVRDASRALESIVEEHKDEAHALALRCELTRAALPVRIDAMMLKRCLDNLVRNAAQALREHGSGSGLIVLYTSRANKYAVLEVRDNGPGVPLRDRGHIFDPYFTTKNEGTGLGLPIVKKVVLEHDGEIVYGEGEHGGASFRITLPLFT